MSITTSDFLTSVKRNVTVPANQIRFTNADILSMADEQMMVLLTPIITSLRQEYFVRPVNVPMAANQSEYKIPYRSIGRTLREVKVSDVNGKILRNLPLINPEDYSHFVGQTGEARGYILRADNIQIVPLVGSTTDQQLNLFYELAPSQLVETSEAGVVVSADYNTGVITMEGAITGFATGQTMDLIDGKSGNNVTALDIINTNVTTNTVTFATTDLPSAPNALKAGDYVALSNQSPVLQIPNEAFFVLVQAVSAKLLEAQGDFEGFSVAEAKLVKNIESLEKLLTPRVRSDAPTILNTQGLIRNSFGRNWWTNYNL